MCTCGRGRLLPPARRAKRRVQRQQKRTGEHVHLQEDEEQHATDAAVLACDEEGLGDVLVEGDNLRLELVGRLREWHRGRAPVAVELRLVSRHWRRAREKPTNDLKAELARLKQHQVVLDDVHRRGRLAFLSRFGPEY